MTFFYFLIPKWKITYTQCFFETNFIKAIVHELLIISPGKGLKIPKSNAVDELNLLGDIHFTFEPVFFNWS